MDAIFSVGRVFKKAMRLVSPPVDSSVGMEIKGGYLLSDGEAVSEIPAHDCIGVVNFMQSLVEGAPNSGTLPGLGAKEGFVELSIFDPLDQHSSEFYFVLLAYSRSVVESYVEEMSSNLLSESTHGDRGLIIPSLDVYRQPVYSVTPSNGLPVNRFANYRSDRPTLYMGVFPSPRQETKASSEPTKEKMPSAKVESFLRTASTRISSASKVFATEVTVSAAILVTFPRPLAALKTSPENSVRGGGMFVYGNYGEDLMRDVVYIQSRIHNEIMRISHTQADMLRALEEAEESGRAARAHEIRKLIAALDQSTPPCLFTQVRDYFRLVVSFDQLAPSVPASLRELIELAAEKACCLAVACREGLAQSWKCEGSWTNAAPELVEKSFFETWTSEMNLSLDLPPEFEDLSAVLPEHLKAFYMAVICLMRNVYMYKERDGDCAVGVRQIEGCKCLVIFNKAREKEKSNEDAQADCNTEKAGKYYVRQFRGSVEHFLFEESRKLDDGKIEWRSTCPLPLVQ